MYPCDVSTRIERLGAATAIMTFAVFLSRVVGYLREMYVAAAFGAGPATDAFYNAFTVPDLLNYLAAGGTLSITFLPLYARFLAGGDEAEANRVFSNIFTILVGVVTVGVVVLELVSRPLVSTIFHRLDREALEICIRCTRILLPAQVFFFAGALWAGTLLARGRFVAAAIAPLVYNIGIIGGGWLLSDRLGVEALAWGALVGAAVGPCLVPMWDALRAGARLRPMVRPGHPVFREWVKLSLPLMIGVSLVTADEWLLRYFASGEAGEVTHLQLARRLVLVPIAIAGQAVGQASMPFFARLHAEGKLDELAAVFARTARAAASVSMLVAGGMIALALPLVDIVYRRGAFEPANVPPTALYLAVLSLSVPMWAVQGLAARVFYAGRNTLTPMLAGTAVTVVSVPVYWLAFHQAGVVGLPWASVLGITLHAVVLLWLLPRIIPGVRQHSIEARRGFAGALATTVLASGAAAVTSLVVERLLSGSLGGHAMSLARLVAGGIAFVALVFALAHRLGFPEPRRIAHRLLRRRV